MGFYTFSLMNSDETVKDFFNEMCRLFVQNVIPFTISFSSQKMPKKAGWVIVYLAVQLPGGEGSGHQTPFQLTAQQSKMQGWFQLTPWSFNSVLTQVLILKFGLKVVLAEVETKFGVLTQLKLS